ncbi:DMT family transporter [Actinokineospora sp. G85]|uniref:DMT family transporter n=1 Tax=Actinokineospora sp. G85 TaxID=3406626 RepID=UPI003C73D142
MSTTKNYTRGVLLCLVATLSWGGMFPVMTSALREIDPFTFTCLRYALAGMVFLAVLLAVEGRQSLSIRGQRPWLAWVFGTAGFAGFQFLVFLGQQLAGPDGALVASIMMATMPVQAFLVNWVIRRAVPPKAVLGFILMSFAGVVLVVTEGDLATLVRSPGDFGADLLIVLGATCWVVYTIGGSFFPQWSPIKYTTVTTGLGLTSATATTAVLLATGAVTTPTLTTIAGVTPELAYMSLIAGFVGVLAWNTGNKILTPLNGMLFMDVVPITAFIISAATGTIPAPLQVTGALITATALVLNNLHTRRRAAAVPVRPKPRATEKTPA